MTMILSYIIFIAFIQGIDRGGANRVATSKTRQQEETDVMSGVEVTELPIPYLMLGEGPHWMEDLQALIFVDAYSKILRRHFIETNRHQVLHIDDGGEFLGVSFVIPVECAPELLMVGLSNTLAVVRWSPLDPDTHTVQPTLLHTISTDFAFNDAKCDPQGRLWAGTLSEFNEQVEPLEYDAAGLYKYDYDLGCTKHLTVTLSNGMTWSLDRKHFYYIDSVRGVYKFDYDDTTGTISNQQMLLDFNATGLLNQIPDGMTIDADGNLWIACFGGSQVICVDPNTGDVLRNVVMPVSQVASVCWGGEDYATLYVTTGTLGLTPEQIAASPKAGATFAVTGLGTHGFPPKRFKANLHKLKKHIYGGVKGGN